MTAALGDCLSAFAKPFGTMLMTITGVKTENEFAQGRAKLPLSRFFPEQPNRAARQDFGELSRAEPRPPGFETSSKKRILVAGSAPAHIADDASSRPSPATP